MRLAPFLAALVALGACQKGELVVSGDSDTGTATGETLSDSGSTVDSPPTDTDLPAPVDADGDGFDAVSDCDDANNTIHPAADESCGDDIDTDCDGEVDAENALGCTDYYADADEDGFGVGTPRCLCATEGVYTVLSAGDCLDSDGRAHPGQSETFPEPRADGSWDYDCDGTVTLAWPDQIQCRPLTTEGLCGDSTGAADAPGWVDAVPACGEAGGWNTFCRPYDVGGSYACSGDVDEDVVTVQACR